jgi:hypothetical protein
MPRRKPKRRSRLLIDQAEALGEPPEDPLLLFSVLFGSWLAALNAFDGDAVGKLATQFLSLAEKQGATIPLVVGHRLMGISLAWTGDIAEGRARTTIRASCFTILPYIARWRRDLGKTPGCQSYAIGRWRCGCLAIPTLRSQTQSRRSRKRATSAKLPL